MYLKSLGIKNLRNLTQQSLCFSPGVTLVFGDNGQGKTSFLEAIFLLSYARSFRTNKLSEIIPIGREKEEVYVEAVAESSLGTFDLSLSVEAKKRALSINNKRVKSAADFCGHLKAVIFTPDDLELIKGAPSIRRQFIDRALVMLDSSYVQLLSDYEKTLRFRNILLKEGSWKEVEILTEGIAKLNYQIIEKRLNITAEFLPYFTKYYESIVQSSELEKVNFSLSSDFVNEGVVFGVDKIIEKIVKDSDRERILKRAIYGCHKDELKINLTSVHGTRLSRGFSSQGQSRTQAISLKLAAAELIFIKTREWPILLLDDVESEFDKGRRGALFELLRDYKGQVFITGTDKINEFHAGAIDHLEVIKGALIQSPRLRAEAI